MPVSIKIMHAFVIVLFILIDLSYAQNNESDFDIIDEGGVISSIPFQNYEIFCPHHFPVINFQYKIYGVKDEPDSMLFNVSTWPIQDVVMKAPCFNLTNYFGDEWEYLSWPECRLGEHFVAGQNIWDNDPAYTCTDGEYVNGVTSVYVNGSRLLRIRCCKLTEFQLAEADNCYQVPNDVKYNQLILKHGMNCTVDVLTAVTVSRAGPDHVVSRYCGFKRQQAEIDPYCAVKRRIEVKKALKKLGPPSDVETLPVENTETRLDTGTQTTPGGSFDFICPDYGGIDGIEVEKVNDDILFTFSCRNITEEEQGSRWVGYTDYQALPSTDDVLAGCDYREDEFLCGVKSYVSPRALHPPYARLYSFACCTLANARVTDKLEEWIKFDEFVRDEGTGVISASSRSPISFMHRFHMEDSSSQNATLVTAWSTYQFDDVPRQMPLNFVVNEASRKSVLLFAIFVNFMTFVVNCYMQVK